MPAVADPPDLSSVRSRPVAAERLISLPDAAVRFGVPLPSLIRRDWRARYGAPVLRIGGKLFVDPAPFRAWISAQREGRG